MNVLRGFWSHGEEHSITSFSQMSLKRYLTATQLEQHWHVSGVDHI